MALLPFAWALAALVLLRLSERWIHLRLQELGYRLTGNQAVALALYAIILFPGVLLHELSHWLAAHMMGVRTGRLSLIPAVRDGKLQLGAVEIYPAGLDPLRESLIGGAPLITGCVVLLLIANNLFGIAATRAALTGGNLQAVLALLWQSLRAPDFWLWFYLAFAIANAMMPSSADRRAWPAFAVIAGLLTGVLLLAGLNDLLLAGLNGPLAVGASYLAAAFSFTVGINLLVMAILGALGFLLAR